MCVALPQAVSTATVPKGSNHMNTLAVSSQELAPQPTEPGFAVPDMPRSRGSFAGVSTKAGRKGDDYVFEPRESSFFILEHIELRSRPIQIAFDKTFQRCQLALYESELIAPIIARDDDKVRALNATIDGYLRSIEKYLEGENGRANKVLTDNGKALNAGDYSNPEDHEVRIYSPRARTLLAMLRLADETITIYGRLWMEGFMGEIDFRKSVFAIRMRVIYLARDIWAIHHRSYLALQRARTKAEQERTQATAANAPELDSVITAADKLLGDVNSRGGMEGNAPDFGQADLSAEAPDLMQKEASTAKKHQAKVAAVSGAGDQDKSTGAGKAAASA